MAAPKTETLLQRVLDRGELVLLRIDELLDQDPDRFEDEFSGAPPEDEPLEADDEGEAVRP